VASGRQILVSLLFRQRVLSVEPNDDFFHYLSCFFRESRAVDMESLCVVAGKHVWSVRVDLHILDNGGYVLLGYALSDDIINLRTNTSKLRL